MKLLKPLFMVGAVVAASVAVFAQDPVKVDPTHYKVLLENASVRVLRAQYGAGAKSVMHQHPDTMVVALTPSKVRFNLPDGKSQDSDMANESAMYIPAGLHNPTNMGAAATDVIVVELKAATAGKAALPASREGMTLKVLAEGPRGMVYRSTASPTFTEPAGTKHDFDQVLIPLSSSGMSLAITGQPVKTSWTRGEAVFVGRGVTHEAKNTGGKAVDFIIVAIK